MPTTGLNDTFWNTLEGGVFKQIHTRTSGIYKNYITIDVIRTDYNTQAPVQYSGHYYFVYDTTTGLLDRLHMSLEASWTEGSGIVSVRTSIDIRQYYPHPDNTLLLEIIPVVVILAIAVLVGIVRILKKR